MNKEKIAVIKKGHYIKIPEGVSLYNESIKNNIVANIISYPRYLAELDINYKQIVSYIICLYENNKIFLMQRKKSNNQGELSEKYSIGIGGHLNKKDIQKNINDWGIREFHEEINYHHKYTIMPYAFLNDNSNSIGKLHLGVVYIMKIENFNISITSELKQGFLIELSDIKLYYAQFESWSQLLLPFLLIK